MPTAAKLVAALGLAVLALALSEIVKATYDPGTVDFGSFSVVNAVLGLGVGWLVIGRRAGQGIAVGVSNGLTGAVALVFWGLFIQATNEMVDRSMQRNYSGPADAFDGLLGISVDMGARLLSVEFSTVMVIGGILCGLLAEVAARRWR